MSTRRNELTRAAARLFAEKGYHGTSTADLAEALGVQKGSLYAHIDSKADLLWEVAREGAAAFHAALDAGEVENLFRVVRQLVAQGVAVVYISHRLEEIRQIGDRITVLKDGTSVATDLPVSETPCTRGSAMTPAIWSLVA